MVLTFVNTITIWFDSASKWSEKAGDFGDAEKYLQRALDYYCDPTLDYDDNVINEAKSRMCNLVEYCLLGIYNGSHEINEY